jgi:hypothetical protein
METAIVAPILGVLGGLLLLSMAWITFQYFFGGKSG